MAETAGLVLGGIALVGLISTCVEIAEYLESAKNRAGDFKMALTKVNLIKQRLRDWGAAMPVAVAPYPQSNHTVATAECGVLIKETLFRIKILLDKTNRMSQRYCLRSPSHQCDLNSHLGSRFPSEKLLFWSHSPISDTSLPTDSGASFQTGHPRFPRLLLSFSLKFLWVFQDRKRFDTVIEQLDFLLSNLEKISETLQGRCEMAQNGDLKRWPAGENNKVTEEELKNGFTDQLEMQSDSGEEAELTPEDRALVAAVSQSGDQSPHWHYPNHNGSGPMVLHKTARSEHPPSGSTKPPINGQSNSQNGKGCAVPQDIDGHYFEDCKSHDASNLLQGNVGRVRKDLARHEFKSCHSYGNSLLISGSMNSNVVTEILKSRASMKDEKAADRNAAQAPETMRTGSIRERNPEG